jgi:hypothetical protein
VVVRGACPVETVSLFGNLEPAVRVDSCLQNVWAAPPRSGQKTQILDGKGRSAVRLTLGVDVACRAAHQASLAGPDGTLVWSGRKFFTRPADLERLWDDLDLDLDQACGADELTVVMEPTRNAWVPLASWFRRRGTRVVLVPTTQSADLRAYYSKHTKNDHLDSKILARLPLLHPDGLREHTDAGPAGPLRRIVKQRSSVVKRRTAIFQRLDAQLELLGPAWYDALRASYGKAALAVLARSATRTDSPAWPRSAPTQGWSPRSTSPASANTTTARPRPATPSCARPCTPPPTQPARPTPSSPRNTPG